MEGQNKVGEGIIDEIFSAKLPLLDVKLPFWMHGRNLIFLDAYYMLAETVEKGTWNPITSRLINIHTGEPDKGYKGCITNDLNKTKEKNNG